MTIPHATFLFNRHPVKPACNNHNTNGVNGQQDDNNNNNGGGRPAPAVTPTAPHHPTASLLPGTNEPPTSTTNTDMTLQYGGGAGSTIVGQKWHIVGFNSAPVLHALLSEGAGTGAEDVENADGNTIYAAAAEDNQKEIDCCITDLFKDYQHLSFQQAIRQPQPEPDLPDLPHRHHQGHQHQQHQEEQKQKTDTPKRTRKKTIPPLDYVCKLCNKTGHWMEDCDYYRPHTIVLHPTPRSTPATGTGTGTTTGTQDDIPPPPPNYLCRLCMVPGHWIDQCARFTPKCSGALKGRSNRSPHHGR